jgi:SAM-dependent methyltransferase
MDRRSRSWIVAALLTLAAAFTLPSHTPTGAAARGTAEAPARKPDVIYVPTPQEVVDRMLELAEVKEGDVLYDLGCGDGRIVVTAAKRYGVKCIGFDIDPRRVAEARENARKSGVEHLVTIKEQDIFTADFRDATVVTLFLLPNLNLRLRPKLAALKPGSRVVSHAFAMRGAKPRKVEKVRIPGGKEKLVYLWVVPWEKQGGR